MPTPEYIAEIEARLNAQEQQKALEKFRLKRQHAIETAVVTTSAGNQYDADEISIVRLTAAVTAASGQLDTYELPWSLASTDTGVMTTITLADLKEAQQLAVLNMGNNWGIES